MSGDWWNESLDSEPEMPVLRNRWTAVIGWWSETSGSDQKQAAVIENDECAVPQTKEISNESFITCNFICISRLLVIVNCNGFQFFLTPRVLVTWCGVLETKVGSRSLFVVVVKIIEVGFVTAIWILFGGFVWYRDLSLTSAELVVILNYAT